MSNAEIKSRKARALITFLVLDSVGSYRRDTLANLLWGGTGRDERSRASLRQCVSALRKALDDVEPGLIGGEGDKIWLASDRVRTDFDVLLERILLLEVDHKEIETAVDRVSNVLAEFDGLSDPFDVWISEIRSRLSRQLLEVMRTVLRDKDKPTDLRRSLARAARSLDAFAEDALRAEMSAEVELGNAAAALRLYGVFCARLEEEMDAEPSPETQDLAVSIKLARDGGTPNDRSSPASFLPATTVAVLPFELIGPDRPPDFVALGILDQLSCHLASYRAPAVISSNTTRRYLGASPRPSDIGRDLDVAYVVSGSVLLDGDSATVSVQVSETVGERLIWGRTQSCDARDVLGIQAELSENIARAIMPSINIAELQTQPNACGDGA